MMPINCDKATMLLERRWDHALNGEEESALDAHLGGCDVCRAEAEAIAMADSAFLHLEEFEPPVNIVAAVAQRIAEESPAEPRRGLFWGVTVVLAGIVAALWHFGLTPAALAHSPVVAALLGPVADTVAGWLRPVTSVLGAFGPVAGEIAKFAVVPVALEGGLLAAWLIRRGHGKKAQGAGGTTGGPQGA